MKIAIDISPIEGKSSLQHRVRGTGFYLKNLKEALLKYYPENEYIFFTRGNTLPDGRQKLPKNVDLVHYPYFEPFFLTLPIFNVRPFVVTVHDLTPLVFPQNFQKGIRGSIKWKIQKHSLKSANRIITDSNSSKEDIIKYAGISGSKIDTVYLAPGENFKKRSLSESEAEKIKKKYKLPEKFALYVGDVTWNKNLPRMLKACVNANVPLVMVGKAISSDDFDRSSPWNQDLLEVQRICKDNNSIIRIGFVEEDDLVSLYNIAEVFIMPSFYEGFGLPILEAMSCGCPVITSKEGSLPEVAGEAAYYVNAHSKESIQEGISNVFNNKNLRDVLCEKGFTQAKKFSWTKTAQNTINTYEHVLEKENEG